MLPEDIHEVHSSSGRTPSEALERAVSLSSRAFTVLVNETVCMIFGVGHFEESKRGTVWLLRSIHHKKLSVRDHKMLSEVCWSWLSEGYETLENMVPESNQKTLRWLSKLGFTIGDTITLGDISFKHFYKNTQCATS